MSARNVSPVRERPRRQAGEGLRTWLAVERDWFLVYVVGWVFAMGVAVCVVWICWFGWREATPWMMTGIGVATGAGLCVRSLWRIRQGVSRERGLRGELAAAEWLEELSGMGYRVFHDLQSETREGEPVNIDHAAVGPAGVFVIETKFRSKGRGARAEYDGRRLVVGGVDEGRALRQARACRDDVGRRLAAIGLEQVPVRAVVVLPGWFVKGGSGAEVWVLNEKAVAGWVEREGRGCDQEVVRRAVEFFDGWAREG